MDISEVELKSLVSFLERVAEECSKSDAPRTYALSVDARHILDSYKPFIKEVGTMDGKQDNVA